MFGTEEKKTVLPRFNGQVAAQFYDDEYYLKGSKSNWDHPYEWKHFASLFRHWAEFIVKGFPDARSFLDVGCARGFLEKAFINLAKHNERVDIAIEGFDFSEWAITNAEPEAKEFVSLAGVDDFVFRHNYDVMISLDTFEHLTNKQVTEFLSRSRHYVDDCGFFVIALDEERQLGDPSHINLTTREWWDDKFKQCGWIEHWQTKMMKTLAMREQFIQECKVEVFIYFSREPKDWITNANDEKLLEFAKRGRWQTQERDEID